DLYKSGFTQGEIDIAKIYVTGNFLLSLENSTNRMLKIGREISYSKRIVPIDEMVKMIKEVREKDINNLVKEYLDLGKFSIAATGPVNEKLMEKIAADLKV
ncbi:MAG: hypothetical protein ABIL20_08240, partial [candidate division WOR-3 bacterium]